MGKDPNLAMGYSYPLPDANLVFQHHRVIIIFIIIVIIIIFIIISIICF